MTPYNTTEDKIQKGKEDISSKEVIKEILLSLKKRQITAVKKLHTITNTEDYNYWMAINDCLESTIKAIENKI